MISVVLFLQSGNGQFLSAQEEANPAIVIGAIPGDEILRELIIEIYRRAEIPLQIIEYSEERSIYLADTGVIDGQTGRVETVVKRYPDLLPVGRAVYKLPLYSYSTDPGLIKVTEPQLLNQHRLGIKRGVKLAEEYHARYPGNIVIADEYSHLVEMLMSGRIHSVLLPSTLVHNLPLPDGVELFRSEKPVMVLNLYHYLHKKHSALIPALSRAIQEIYDDGTWFDIMEVTLQ